MESITNKESIIADTTKYFFNLNKQHFRVDIYKL
jgi:hypothetical protein